MFTRFHVYCLGGGDVGFGGGRGNVLLKESLYFNHKLCVLVGGIGWSARDAGGIKCKGTKGA